MTTERSLIRRTGDVLLRAVRQGDKQTVVETTILYQSLMEAFVQELRSYGWIFTEDVLRQDLEGWTILREISSTIREFVGAAVESDSQDMLQEASRLSSRLIYFGLEQREYLTFKTGLDVLSSIYFSHRELHGLASRYARENIPLRLTEIANYNVLPAIENSREETDKESLGQFVKAQLISFQNLLVQSVVTGDRDEFQALLESCGQLFRPMRLTPNENVAALTILRSDGVVFTLGDGISLVLTGVGVRAIIELERQNLHGAELVASLLTLLPQIPEYTSLVLRVLQSDLATEFGWDFWDLRVGEAQFVRTNEWIERLYALRALTSPLPVSVPSGERSRDLARATEQLQTLIDNPTMEPVIALVPPSLESATDQSIQSNTSRARRNVDRLIALHRQAVHEWEDKEEEEIMAAPLSRGRIEGLEKSINEHYMVDDGIRRAYAAADRLFEEADWPDERLRISAIWSARGFMTELPRWATIDGRDFVQTLLDYRRSLLIESAPKPGRLHDPSELWDDIGRWLASQHVDHGLLLLAGDWIPQVPYSDDYLESWRLAEDSLKGATLFSGRFRGIPVFRKYESERRMAYVFNIARHGHFVDCLSDGKSAWLQVREFGERDAIEQIRESGPLKDGERTLSEAASIRWLRSHVQLRVVFGTSYVVENETAAASFAYRRPTSTT